MTDFSEDFGTEIIILTKNENDIIANKYYSKLLIQELSVTIVNIDEAGCPQIFKTHYQSCINMGSKPPFIFATGRGMMMQYTLVHTKPVEYFINTFIPIYEKRCESILEKNNEVSLGQVKSIPSPSNLPNLNTNHSFSQKEVDYIQSNVNNDIRIDNTKCMSVPLVSIEFIEKSALVELVPSFDNISLHIALDIFESKEDYRKAAIVANELKYRGVLNDYKPYDLGILKIKK